MKVLSKICCYNRGEYISLIFQILRKQRNSYKPYYRTAKEHHRTLLEKSRALIFEIQTKNSRLKPWALIVTLQKLQIRLKQKNSLEISQTHREYGIIPKMNLTQELKNTNNQFKVLKVWKSFKKTKCMFQHYEHN